MRQKPRLKLHLKKSIFWGTAFLVAGIIFYYFLSQALIQNIKNPLMDYSQQSSKIVESEIKNNLNILETISSDYVLKSSHFTTDEKIDYLADASKKNSYKRLSIVDLYGNARTTDKKEVYVGDRAYFKAALSGNAAISEPLKSRIDNTTVIVFAVPIKDNNSISGVLYSTLDMNVLCKILDNVKRGNPYSSFIINKKGTVIADESNNNVYLEENLLDNAVKDPGQQQLADLIKQMTEGKSGIGECVFRGVRSYMAFKPITGTDWSIAVTIPKSHAFKSLNTIILIILILVLLISFLVIFYSLYTKFLESKLSIEKSTTAKVIEAANIIVIYINSNGKIKNFNQYAEKKTGIFREDAIENKSIFNITPGSEHGKIRDLLQPAGEYHDLFGFEFSLIDRVGRISHIVWNVEYSEETSDNNAYNIELLGLDITKRVEAENNLLRNHLELTLLYDELSDSKQELGKQFNELCETQEKLLKSEKKYQLALEGSNDGIWDWDIADNKLYYSDNVYEMLGYGKNELSDTYFYVKSLIHPEDLASVEKTVAEYTMGPSPLLSFEVRLRTKSGNYKWFLIRGKALRDDNNKIIRTSGSLSDIDERITNEKLITKMAYHDFLTDLPNRVMLYEKVRETIKTAVENRNKGAFVLIDLDNFKDINDSYGHSFGDLLIKEISRRLTASVDNNCTVFRLGGDEFIILIENLKDKLQCEDYLNKVMDTFSVPIPIDGRPIHVSCSIGISLFPDDSDDVESLLKNSDSAMYYAKKKRKRKYMFFDKSMNDEIVEKMELESKLRTAIENNEFILNYQPQIELKTGKIRGFEALIRWINPESGLIPPLKFIGIAEETGLIIPIGSWVLKTACQFCKRLQKSGYGKYNISVNVSIIQLIQDDFVDIVINTLKETGLEPKYLEIELTESVLMESIEQCMGKLEKLRNMGIKVSLDDFGKGYSSFSYLKQLPINVLKIDKSFIDDINTNSNITESIVHFGHKLGLYVIAEGVENSEQLEYLVKSHCNIVQGYFFSKPVSEQDAIKIIGTSKFLNV